MDKSCPVDIDLGREERRGEEKREEKRREQERRGKRRWRLRESGGTWVCGKIGISGSQP